MRPVSGAEPSRLPRPERGSRVSANATPYARRRFVAVCLLFAALWLGLSGCRAVLDWLGGPDAQADDSRPPSEHRADGGPASGDGDACPSDAELYGEPTDEPPAALRQTIDQLL